MNEFERLTFYLTDRDGYIRHQGLTTLTNCFEPQIFPSLLRCLSDYVEENRNVATHNLKIWSEQADFSQLCIDHFDDVAAIQHRTRRMHDIESIIFEKIVSNITYLKQVMLNQQGRLARLIFQYVKQYQWIASDELEQLCKYAKDPMIRAFWLQCVLLRNQDEELKKEFRQSLFRDIQLQLLRVLQAKERLDIDELLLAWKSKYSSVMDYAYFLLRQRAFDFEKYFTQYAVNLLDLHQQKIRAQQWLLMKWDKAEFLQLLAQMSHLELRDSYVILALKQGYLSVADIITLGGLKQVDFSFSLPYVERLLKAWQSKVTVDELLTLLQWTVEQPSLYTMLAYLDYLSYWDGLYWVICLIEDYPEYLKASPNHLDQLLGEKIQLGRYISFPPPWQAARAERVAATVHKYLQKTNTKLDIKDYEKMLNTLKKRC